MTHRHLLPDEIDALLDSEVGFGVAPLEAHLRECASCRADLEAGRRVVEAIEQLPRLAPTPLFGDHVMAQVNVYEPWYVAARDTADEWATLVRARVRDTLFEQLGTAVSTVFGPQSAGALRAGGPALLFVIIATAAVLIVAAGLAVRSAVASPGRGTRRSGS